MKFGFEPVNLRDFARTNLFPFWAGEQGHKVGGLAEQKKFFMASDNPPKTKELLCSRTKNLLSYFFRDAIRSGSRR